MLICPEQRAEWHYIVTLLIPQYVTYLLCVAIQGTFLFYVRTLVSDKDTSISDVVCKEPNEGVSSALRLVCMTMNVASVLKDVGETISMHRWLNSIPRWAKEQQDILEYACKTSGLTDFPFQKYKNDDDGMELLKPAVGMSTRSRLFAYVSVLLVRLVMASVVLIYGTAYVGSASSDEDLIKDTVAMIFILEIDDLLYELMTPSLYKTWVTTCSVISFDEDEIDDNYSLYWPYFVIVTIGGTTSALYGAWC